MPIMPRTVDVRSASVPRRSDSAGAAAREHRVERRVERAMRVAEPLGVVGGRADPDAGLAVVGREDAGERPVAEVVLDRRPVAGEVRVVRRAAAAWRTSVNGGADRAGDARADARRRRRRTEPRCPRGRRRCRPRTPVDPAAGVTSHAVDGHAGHQAGTGRDGGSTSKASRTWRRGATSMSTPQRSLIVRVDGRAAGVELDLANRRCARVEHVPAAGPSGQAAPRRCGRSRGSTACRSGKRAVDEHHVVAGRGEQHRGGRAGASGADDDDVVN